MEEQDLRTAMLLGEEGVAKLHAARVAVFGVGGVGGYAVEALARSGVGALDLFDPDTVSPTDLNRQLLALHSTVGRYKVDVAAERIRDISPVCNVTVFRVFFLPSNAEEFDFSRYDYVIDAIDTVSGKLAIVLKAKEAGVPVISAMGAGNKLDPTAFSVTDLAHTSVCPLARTMRRELRKRGIEHLKVVCSSEAPLTPAGARRAPNGKTTPGSIAFVPGAAGLALAGEVINDIALRGGADAKT